MFILVKQEQQKPVPNVKENHNMCGIVGAVAKNQKIGQFLLSGLSALEYRGYDSAGIALINPEKNSEVIRCRTSGRVAELIAKVKNQGVDGKCGIAHTRWATHGEPTEGNAHPHISGTVCIVHNGIIENHLALKAKLIEFGYKFTTQTDSEVIAHMVHHYHQNLSLKDAIAKAVEQMEGIYAFVAISGSSPDMIIGVTNGAPLVIGVGEDSGENIKAGQINYLASDYGALIGYTKKYIRLKNGDIVELYSDKINIYAEGKKVEREIKVSDFNPANISLCEYDHYMQKEIFEQPLALAQTLEFYGFEAKQLIGAINTKINRENLSKVENLIIIGCGTSYHAGLTAKYWFEKISRLPCSVEIASEYRYREIVVPKNSLVIAISQSGETADTISALNFTKKQNPLMTVAITNVAHSAIVEQAFVTLLTHAGPEIGVASTKAFTTQLGVLAILAIALAIAKKAISEDKGQNYLNQLIHIPQALKEILKIAPQINALAEKFVDVEHALFLGRGIHYPIAMEGALKLKEISYIHAEAYPAGELKHGPLALVDKNMPVIAIAPNDQLMAKLLSNLEEVRARGGRLFVFSESGVDNINKDNVTNILLGQNIVGEFSPIVNIVPLQLFAYYIALMRGTDVDRPRNLAKSVTVE